MPRARATFTEKEYIQTPSGGWAPDIPPWELPDTQATALQNFQIKPGKLRVRPAYVVTADLTSAAVSLAGWIPYKHGTSLLTRRLFTSGFNVEPQNVHRVGVNVPGSTNAVENAMYEITGSTVTRHAITPGPGSGSGLVPGWRQVDFNGNKYALTYTGLGSATLPFNDGVTGWFSNVMQITTPSTVAAVNGPAGGFDIYGWLDRLWVAGGAPFTSPTLGSTTVLFFTNPIQALTNTSTDWIDPVSGLYNQIDIDGEHSNPIVALASVPAGMIILRQNSVFILRGTDPTSYVLRPVSKQAGCIDARSVVEMDGRVYFMSEQGLMVTDGTQVQNVSGALQDELYRQVATWNNAVFNSTGAWCTADAMSDNKILVSFGSYTAGSVPSNYTMVGAFSAIFDPATDAWVRVTTLIQPTGGSFSTALGPSIEGYGELQTLGNTQVVHIEDNVTGQCVSGASSLWDVSTVAGAFQPIGAAWVTKSPQAALGARTGAKLKRWYLDFACGTGGSQTGTMTVQLFDRTNLNSLEVTSVTMPATVPGPRQYMQRHNESEVSDLGINVSLQGTTGGATTCPSAEVHGIGIEFQPIFDMPDIV